MSKILNLKSKKEEGERKKMKDSICKFINTTKNNLIELKKELCRQYENWELSQDDFNASMIMAIRLDGTFNELERNIKEM